jgi:N-acetylmuramoyl-L-alanine amidase
MLPFCNRMNAIRTLLRLIPLAVLLTFGAGWASAFQTVVIDPGHGGSDLGAADSYVYEKHINLDVARRLERSLKEAGFKTIMTRTRDEFIALSERSSIANRQRNAIFVSVHFNSSYRTAALGIETFYRSADSEKLAQLVQRELIKNVGATDRGVKTANFAVLRNTKHPAVLVEGGFVSNKDERSAMCDPLYRQVVADSIARAVIQFKR